MTDENRLDNKKKKIFNDCSQNKPITRAEIKIHKLVRDISDKTTLLDNPDLKCAVLEDVNRGSNRIITRSMLPFLKQSKIEVPVEDKKYMLVKEQKPDEEPEKAFSEMHFRNCAMNSPSTKRKKQKLISRDLIIQKKISVVSERSGKLANHRKVRNSNLKRNSKTENKEEDWINQTVNYVKSFFTDLLPF